MQVIFRQVFKQGAYDYFIVLLAILAILCLGNYANVIRKTKTIV